MRTASTAILLGSIIGLAAAFPGAAPAQAAQGPLCRRPAALPFDAGMDIDGSAGAARLAERSRGSGSDSTSAIASMGEGSSSELPLGHALPHAAPEPLTAWRDNLRAPPPPARPSAPVPPGSSVPEAEATADAGETSGRPVSPSEYGATFGAPLPPRAEADAAREMAPLPAPAARAPASPPSGPSAFESRVPSSPPQRTPQAGLLTAGDHDDLLNPRLYARYAKAFIAREPLRGIPHVDTERVLTVAVTDAVDRPVPFAAVTLTCADGNSLTLKTLADGTVAFFPMLDNLGESVAVSVRSGQGQRVDSGSVDLRRLSGGQRQTVTLPDAAAPVRAFDLALVIDTTGSMSDELSYLTAELQSILDGIAAAHPGLDIRVGAVVYRDRGDAYVTRSHGFTKDVRSLRDMLAQQSAGGGGDYPEAVEAAMARAVSLDWREDAVKSLLLVADAPPHAEDVAATWNAGEVARHKRIQIVPVGASGVAEGAEYVMRAMAAVTQSRYVFLTDDSGIGNPHAAPAVDCYKVTRLNGLLRQVLDGQISGRRVEPQPQDVIRTVGNYDNGRCILPQDFSADLQ